MLNADAADAMPNKDQRNGKGEENRITTLYKTSRRMYRGVERSCSRYS